MEEATTTRLLSTSKLSLIVDLDQTIVHATVDPTVGEWLEDPRNPNFSALEGTGKFRLGEENDREGEGCWYYVKMRFVLFLVYLLCSNSVDFSTYRLHSSVSIDLD